MEKEIEGLTESPFYNYRKKHDYNVVIGEGNPDAAVMFIGEAPGKNEAEQGRPFCGRAGDVLNELLQSINVPREDVYIGNVLKDRPPDNRDPFPDEIALYGPYLDKQMRIIAPDILVPLGRFSMEYIAYKFEAGERIQAISRVHGTPFRTKASWDEIVILPMYHPAVATYNPSQKDTLMKDFAVLGELLNGTYTWRSGGEEFGRTEAEPAPSTEPNPDTSGSFPDTDTNEQMNIL